MPIPRGPRPLTLRLHPLMRAALEALARRDCAAMSVEITRALRELLAREGLWPPPADGKQVWQK